MKQKNQEKIALFAFRKRRKSFFEKMVKSCPHENVKIITSRKSLVFSLKALGKIKEADLESACNFAVSEFYAKTNLKIPTVLVKLYFNIFSKINFLRYYAALDKNFTKMLIWNGGKFRERIAIEVAKIENIKVYYFENGLLPNTIVFDNKGINSENSVPRKEEFYKQYNFDVDLPKTLVPRVGKNREIFKGEKEILPEKYIFVPFQVDYDTQIISHSKWIRDMRILFDVIEKISKYGKYHFVLKEHPSSGVEYSDLYERIKELSYVSFKNTYSTQALIENADAVITVNSTVGVESLLFHKKVIVLGDAFYAIEGITFPVKNQQELVEKIDQIDKLNVEKKTVDNFLKYLYHDYLVLNDENVYKTICHKILKADNDVA